MTKDTRKRHATLLKPAIFGLADGCMSLLGVVLFLHGGAALVVFLAAVNGAVSSSFSMAGGQFMTDEDFRAAGIMGLATGIGGILPALPYAFATGTLALWLCIGITMLIGGVVAWMRAQASPKRGWKYTVAVTFAILALIFGVSLACTAVFPAPV